LILLLVLTLLIGITFPLFFLLSITYAIDVAEIAKIIINEQSVDKTEEIHLYRTDLTEETKTDKYIRIPKAQRWDVLDQHSIIETYKPETSARIEFTAEQLLLLGAGTERNLECADVMRGESCAMARFEGLRHEKPFLYIPKGAAWVQNIVIQTDQADTRPSGTEYYISTNRIKTTVIVLDGEVGVRARNIPQEVIVRRGEQTEVLSANRPPTRPVQTSRSVLDDIRRWVRAGVMVIRSPANGAITQQSAIQLSGTVSDRQTRQVELLRENSKLGRVPVVNGEFTGTIPLREGENIITVQTSTRYGEVTESISITKASSQIAPASMPDVRGRAEKAAIHFLVKEGFDRVRVTKKSTGKGREGTVVEQSPAPYTSVPLGSMVDLVVEERLRLVQVPDVRGQTESEARRLLAMRELTVGQVTQRTTGSGKEGTVVEQSPPPNTQVPPASGVDLAVQVTGSETKEAIERIRQGPHQSMPPASSRPTTGVGQGDTKMTIRNDTGHTLLVRFSGPVDRTVQVPADKTEEIALAAGRYQVAAEVTEPGITPFYGEQTYRSNTDNRYRFYLQRR
jgi:hypothetical protein